MRYRAIANVEGEIKPRQVFGDVYASISDWVTKTLQSAPVGTKVEVYEVKEELVKEYVKREKREGTEEETGK